jgi:acyl-CoA oxidase
MLAIQNDTKGVVIAEGDLVPLCSKVFSELLQGQYRVPMPGPKESLLARHASSRLAECTEALSQVGGTRSADFTSVILPQAQPVIEAIGHAIAYAAAVKANLPQPILDIYESSIIRQDPAWYSEHGMPRTSQQIREDKAVSTFIPELPEFLSALEIEKYVAAPVVSDARWKAYLSLLIVYSGDASPSELISCSTIPETMARM